MFFMIQFLIIIKRSGMDYSLLLFPFITLQNVSLIELDDGKIGTGKPYIWW